MPNSGTVDAQTPTGNSAGDSGFESLLRGVAAAPEIPVLETLELPPGTVVANTYRVEARLGHGGMGVVYRATDLRLDRSVALKVHAHAPRERDLDLLRLEAQAMAHLAHPNVIEVFEVGTHEDRLFIAMEFIGGGTLRRWQQDRPWPEVVAAYLEAGRGLAAAHRAGLVHRDFKPDNVLIGTDGRPRVADFGLVLGLDAPLPETLETSRSSGSAPSAPYSDPGSVPAGISARAIAGTPRYMAPEQAAGQGADHRADQYAFCVALHEALLGQPPDDEPTRPARAADVGPMALWRAIQRGLATKPDARHPDMDALLRAIERARRPSRRGPWLGAAATVGLGVAALVWAREDPRATCRAEARAKVAAWEADRARLPPDPPADDSSAPLSARVQSYGEQWRLLREAACETDPGDPRRDPAMRCLDEADLALKGTLAVLASLPASPDPERSLPLPPLERCTLGTAPGPGRPAPAAEIAAEVEAVLAEVARSDALVWSGDRETALAVARAALARAETLDYAPARIDAQLQVADAALEAGDLKLAGEHYEAGFYAAQGLGDDAAATDASGALIKICTDLGEYERADRWVEHALTSYERLGDDLALELSLLSSIGILRQEQGRFDEAREVQERALAMLPSAGDEIRRAKLHNTLGATYDYAGEHEQAIAHFERAIALFEARRGPDHPDNVYPLANLAWARLNRGEHEQAEPILHRAIELLRRTSASDTYALATLLSHLGTLHSERGQHQAALDAYQEALRVAEPELGAEHVLVIQLVMNSAGELNGLGQPERARQTYERALGMFERTVGPEHDDTALALVNLAGVLLEQGQPERALALARRATAIFSSRGDAQTRSPLVLTLSTTAEALLALERASEAVAPFERAVKIAAGGDVSPRDRAQAMLGLATALWTTDPAARPRARRLVEQARAAVAPDAAATETLTQLDAWLAEHPPPKAR